MFRRAPLVVLGLLGAGCGAVTPRPAPGPPLAGPSPACETTPPPAPLQGLVRGELLVDGVRRTYLLSVPPSASPTTPLPLIFGFHGNRWNGESFRKSGGPELFADGRAIFVYPDGLESSIGGSGWDLDLDSRDLALFDALLEDLGKKLCVDRSRVFAFGRSYGGYFVNTLACARAPFLQGVVGLMGGGPFDDRCTGPTAVWLAHAADDPTVSINEGRASRDHHLAINGCDPARARPTTPEPCVIYGGCASGRSVTWCESPGGGHNPPPFYGVAAWDFFVRTGTIAP